MALVSLSNLITQVRRRADLENSQFVTDPEITDYINASATEFYDMLVDAYEDYYVAPFVIFTLTSGNTWPLPVDFYKLRLLQIQQSGTTSWAVVTPISLEETSRISNARLIFQLRNSPAIRYTLLGQNIFFYPEDQVVGYTFRMTYTPQYSKMASATQATAMIQDITYTAQTAGSEGNEISVTYNPNGTAGNETVAVDANNNITVSMQNFVSTAQQIATAINTTFASYTLVQALVTGQLQQTEGAAPLVQLSGGTDDGSIDGINGWEEFVVVDSAIKCLIKQESDTSALQGRKVEMVSRIMQHMANKRDATGLKMIPDMRTGDLGLYSSDMGFYY